MKNDTLVAVTNMFLQEALHAEKFLTALITDPMGNKATILPITNLIKKTARSVLISLAARDRNQEVKQAASAPTAYVRSLQNRRRTPRSSMDPSLVRGPTQNPDHITPRLNAATTFSPTANPWTNRTATTQQTRTIKLPTSHPTLHLPRQTREPNVS